MISLPNIVKIFQVDFHNLQNHIHHVKKIILMKPVIYRITRFTNYRIQEFLPLFFFFSKIHQHQKLITYNLHLLNLLTLSLTNYRANL